MVFDFASLLTAFKLGNFSGFFRLIGFNGGARAHGNEVFSLIPDVSELNNVNLEINALEAKIDKLLPVRDALHKAKCDAPVEIIPYEIALRKQHAAKHDLEIPYDVIYDWEMAVTKEQVKQFKSIAFKLKNEFNKIVNELVDAKVELFHLKEEQPFDDEPDDELIDPPEMPTPTEHTADSVMSALEIVNPIIGDKKLTRDVNTEGFQSYSGDDLRLNIFLENGNHTAVSLASGEQLIKVVRINPSKKQLRDSLKRAMEIAKANRLAARKSHDIKAENYEYELYTICQKALKEVA